MPIGVDLTALGKPKGSPRLPSYKPKTRSHIPVEEYEVTYNSKQMARMANVSLRQLQWWDERKVVSPRHEGHRRVYYEANAIEILVIAELRRKGFSLQRIRLVLRSLTKIMARLNELEPEQNLHLLTDGKVVHLEVRNIRIVNIMRDAKLPMFLVCVSDQAEKMGWQRTASTSTDPLDRKPVVPASTIHREEETSLSRLQRKIGGMHT